MKKQAWRKQLESGTCKCILEPMCEGGLEGYLSGDTYRYTKMQDDKGVYYRVYPNPDSDYYETCGPGLFERFFAPNGDQS